MCNFALSMFRRNGCSGSRKTSAQTPRKSCDSRYSSGAVLASMLALLGVCLFPGSAARAELKLRQPRVDLGELKCGLDAKHMAWFTNQGPGPVEVQEVKVPCGCMKPRVERKTYLPGQEGCVQLEVQTLAQSAGEHRWPIHILYTEAGEQRQAVLELTGRVVAEISVDPAALTIYAARSVRHEVLVTDFRPNPFQVTDVTTTAPGLQARLVERFGDKKGNMTYRVRIEVTQGFPEGRSEDLITIATNDPVYRELRVPVTVTKHARQRVTASPGIVSFRAATGQPIPARLLLLRDSRDEPIVIDRVTADDPAIVCTFAQGPSATAAVRLTIDKLRLQRDHLLGSVQIHLSKPVAQSVTVPVECRIE